MFMDHKVEVKTSAGVFLPRAQEPPGAMRLRMSITLRAMRIVYVSTHMASVSLVYMGMVTTYSNGYFCRWLECKMFSTFVCLDSWSPAGDTVLRGYRTFWR